MQVTIVRFYLEGMEGEVKVWDFRTAASESSLSGFFRFVFSKKKAEMVH